MLNKVTNRIPEILEQEGMTQNDLAKRANLPEAQINKIIRGVNTPRLDTAYKICRALNRQMEKVFIYENGRAA